MEKVNINLGPEALAGKGREAEIVQGTGRMEMKAGRHLVISVSALPGSGNASSLI